MPAQHPTDVDAVVDALYTRPLDEFVAARDAAVRQVADGGDRIGAERVKRLPKPSVAAWVINRVARDHPQEIEALADLGDELRAATQDRDRGRLRALDHLRRERTEGLVRTVREAGEVGGRTVSSAVLDRLTETLTAAVMDPDAAVVVRAGRLSRALQHVGFGIVDEQGEDADLVVLHPARSHGGPRSAKGSEAEGSSGPGKPSRAEKSSKAGKAGKAGRPTGPSGSGPAEQDPAAADGAGSNGAGSDKARSDKARSEKARSDLADAEQAVEESSAHVDRLEARRDDARERLRTADAAIERGEGEVERLDEELERLVAERDEARQVLDDAREAADEARTDLTAVEDDLDDAVERAAEARRRRREARGR
ncbi:hypothetical protein APR04_000555 [Promicromonospora umidemergens]|uniref:Transposase n=1 Tax=Promicromonospora umidemergens TaxID=629679 RepID=A0ABP8XDV3_9MICO|nr:hypothetical protein [Promicromonospora umidemergens]MCP2281666.1 hypothetical protein [Promicromonospora umidemergens]